MKVYVVIIDEYDRFLDQVFANEDDAQAHVEKIMAAVSERKALSALAPKGAERFEWYSEQIDALRVRWAPEIGDRAARVIHQCGDARVYERELL